MRRTGLHASHLQTRQHHDSSFQLFSIGRENLTITITIFHSPHYRNLYILGVAFRPIDFTASRAAKMGSKWQPYERIIKELYLDQKKKLDEVRSIMEHDHGFSARYDISNHLLEKQNLLHTVSHTVIVKQSTSDIWQYGRLEKKGKKNR